MTKHRTSSRLLFALGAAALVFSSACGKDKDATPEPAVTPDPGDTETKETTKTPTPTPQAASEDFIKIYAAHEPTTAADPVEITIEKYTVTSASFDPANLEGATAEIALDLSSIRSDRPKRDDHLRSADYLDVGSFGTATIKISEVKHTSDKDYTAQAEIGAHGVTRTWPVKFTVIESKDNTIRVQGEHSFDRMEFDIGKEPDGENEKVARELTLKLQLTLENTGS